MGWFTHWLTERAQQAADHPLPTGCRLIDVRSPAEYASGALPDSLNVPLDVFAREIEALIPERHTPVLVFCAAGARAAQACAHLQRLGYTQVVNGGGVGTVALQLQQPLRRC